MQSKIHQTARKAYEQGDLRGAMKFVGQCLREDCDDGRAWELAGLIHFSAGNFARAVSALERASLLVPLTGSGRVCLPHAYARIGRQSLCCDLLVELISDDSLSQSLLLKVASGLDAVGRPDLAMAACRRGIQRDPDLAAGYYQLGVYATRCGCPNRIVNALQRKAIGLAPDVRKYRAPLGGFPAGADRFDRGQLG